MSGDASPITTAPRPTASDAVREMRATGRAGHAVPADQVNRWATTPMCLFGQQRAVRLEQWGGSFWYQIDEKQWYRALSAGEPVRALYTQPLLHEVRRAVEDRYHIWSADRTHCTVCNDPFDWADPYCNPPKPPVPIALKPQPFNPFWVLPLLDRLERALKRESKHEKSYIYREMSKGNFPSALKIGARTRWCQSEVQQWIVVKKTGNRRLL